MASRDFLHNKKVLVMGFGRQGQALAHWLPTIGAKVTVSDSRTADEIKFRRRDYPGVKFVLGEHPDELLHGTRLICVSGGVPLDLPVLELARERRIPFSNDADLFLERCPAPVIGITGSAGKTTTTSLVGDILKKAGYTTWVGGNIGDVLLDSLAEIKPDDRVVMELSSFQLELMKHSPQIAAVLNITPNHLDRHGTMENYIRAKANIIKHQSPVDVTVLGYDDMGSRALEMLPEGELVFFSMDEMMPDGAFMTGDRLVVAGSASFDYMPHIVCNRDEIPLRGDHNVINVLAACAITGVLGLATDRPGITTDVMREAIINFKPVPHRLEIVRVHNDITYVNDSIATAPERLLAALRSFDEPLVTLIGGADKDLKWDKAVSLALRKSRHVIIFGKEGEKQVRDKVVPMFKLMGAGDDVMTVVDTLDEAIQRATQVARAGDVVLLSPGGTSYDAYQDFAERGEHFRQCVTEL